MAMQAPQSPSLSVRSVPVADIGKEARVCKQLMAFTALVLMLVLHAPVTARAQHGDGQVVHHGELGLSLPTDRLEFEAEGEQLRLAKASFAALASQYSPEQMSSLASKHRQRLTAFVLGGVGLAGLGVGTFLVHRGQSKFDEAPNTDPNDILDLEEQGLRYRRLGFAMVAIGGVSFLSGAIFLLLMPRPMKREAPRLLPSGTASSAGLLLRGAF